MLNIHIHERHTKKYSCGIIAEIIKVKINFLNHQRQIIQQKL